MMTSGKFRIALFPADLADPVLDRESKNVRITHFAFNVNQAEFVRAQAHFKSLGLTFEFLNHGYFHSIYTKDPDAHIVELTTQIS